VGRRAPPPRLAPKPRSGSGATDPGLRSCPRRGDPAPPRSIVGFRFSCQGFLGSSCLSPEDLNCGRLRRWWVPRG
jgi:hypothetical protein